MRTEKNNHRVVSEWEDNILFDDDDPDFCASGMANQHINVLRPSTGNGISLPNSHIVFSVPATMSLASLHNSQRDICTALGKGSISGSSSHSDLVGSPLEISVDNVLSIEELRAQMGSCFTCGVSWTDDHVSLDCGECGGYSLERPCPLCDGRCGVQWKRDFTMSHASNKARWTGVCPSFPEVAMHLNLPQNVTNNTTSSTCGASQFLAQELCARLEQLSASAQT